MIDGPRGGPSPKIQQKTNIGACAVRAVQSLFI